MLVNPSDQPKRQPDIVELFVPIPASYMVRCRMQCFFNQVCFYTRYMIILYLFHLLYVSVFIFGLHLRL